MDGIMNKKQDFHKGDLKLLVELIRYLSNMDMNGKEAIKESNIVNPKVHKSNPMPKINITNLSSLIDLTHILMNMENKIKEANKETITINVNEVVGQTTGQTNEDNSNKNIGLPVSLPDVNSSGHNHADILSEYMTSAHEHHEINPETFFEPGIVSLIDDNTPETGKESESDTTFKERNLAITRYFDKKSEKIELEIKLLKLKLMQYQKTNA